MFYLHIIIILKDSVDVKLNDSIIISLVNNAISTGKAAA